MSKPAPSRPLRLTLVAFGLAGLAMTMPRLAAAQGEDDGPDSVSIPVVQALPGGDSDRLNEALSRLGRNPRDFAALVDAGYAALGMGDGDAAIGFFQRAESLGSGNARVKAGIASAYVRQEDPFSAIPLYAEAEKIAALEPRAQLDRGLAYDMVGDNATAQRLYRAVLASGVNDEATRRLALSLAISGDRAGMEAALSPLLLRQDKAAWRARAFSLAILGKPEEAEAIAKSTLTADQAVAMGAYLRYMPRLTAAQQAAAVNLGHFPRAADIGRDDSRVALFTRPRGTVAAADRQLVPSGQPLGRPPGSSRIREREDGRAGSRRQGQIAPAPPQAIRPSRDPVPGPAPVPAAAPAPIPAPIPAPASAQPGRVFAEAPKPPPASQPNAAVSIGPAATGAGLAVVPGVVTAPLQPVAQSQPAPPVPAAATRDVAPPLVTPGFAVIESSSAAPAVPFDLARASGSSGTTPVVRSDPPRTAPAKPVRGTLADVFADLSAPSREIVPQQGAVDIRTIAPARAATPTRAATSREPGAARGTAAGSKPAVVAAKPAVPSHPSRIWVQLATGRDKAALGFDWRRLVRGDPDVFKTRKPATSAFGQSSRLLTGPFESQAQANAFLAQLRKAGVSGGYVWTSPAGQVVDALAVK